jgi:hypothetical protein
VTSTRLAARVSGWSQNGEPFALDGFAVPLREPETAFHGDDTRANPAHGAGATEQIEVVTGRRLDDFEIAPLLARELAHERERTSMQEHAAKTERAAVGYARGKLGKATQLGCGRRRHDDLPISTWSIIASRYNAARCSSWYRNEPPRRHDA